MFGKGHVEFSTPRQQDAAEYLIHVLDIYRRPAPALAADGRLTQAAEQANAEKTGPVEYGPYDVLSSQPTQQLLLLKVEEKQLVYNLKKYGMPRPSLL